MELSAQSTFESELGVAVAPGHGRISYNPRSRRASTFKSGLEEPVHRWFRLTPSFGSELVRQMLHELSASKDDLILDPFAGASTTLIEAQLCGHSTIGFEINPLLHFVGLTSLDWRCSAELLLSQFDEVLSTFRRLRRDVTFESLESHGYQIPPIHNPLRWWRKDVLMDLLVVKRAIRETGLNQVARNLLLLALAGALVPDLTNVTLGRLQLHFIDRSDDDMDVLGTLTRKVREIAVDLEHVAKLQGIKPGLLSHQDATNLVGYRPPKKIDVVITSPPYPNRYSYVWNTRPHLFFLDLFSTAKQASELDVKTIGGTWGAATSMLMKGVVPPGNATIKRLISPIAEEIRKRDNLMANYLMRYFNLMSKQIEAVTPHLAPSARLAYVVGCSRLKEVFVETDVLLGELFEGLNLGFKLERVERIRKRNSGKDLHESIVYVTRP